MSRPQPSKPHSDLMHTVLRRQCAYLRDIGQHHENRPENTKSAVIVEPRRHELLEPVIRNVMHFLSQDWNLTVICGSDNEEWIKTRLPEWKVRYVNLGVENLTPNLHNRLLQQSAFWETIREETLLVFQTDSCLLRPIPPEMMDAYDFLGAWTLNPHEQAPIAPGVMGGFNGGLSLRSRRAMLDITRNVDHGSIDSWRRDRGLQTLPSVNYFGEIAEDIYFVHGCCMLGKRLPDRDTACTFSTEAVYSVDSVGMHACMEKEFFPLELLREMVRSSELARFL
ncbi:g728 [Coccomyxa elongata]